MEWQWGTREAFFSIFLPTDPKKKSLTKAYVVFTERDGGYNPGPRIRAIGWILDDGEGASIQQEKSFDRRKSGQSFT